jgi:hypothetical protein
MKEVMETLGYDKLVHARTVCIDGHHGCEFPQTHHVIPN